MSDRLMREAVKKITEAGVDDSILITGHVFELSLDKYPSGVYNMIRKDYERGESVDNKCCCERSRRRTEDELRRLSNRLSRVEGQVRGIRKMLEEDAYCIDIITQVSAATSALNSFCKEILTQHLSTCVREDLIEGNDEKLNEVLETMKKMM